MKKIIISFAAFLLLLFALFLAIRPVKTFETIPIDEESLTELMGEKILASVMDMFTEGTDGLQIQISEHELNGMISAIMKDKQGISNLHCVVNQDEIVFYVDSKLAGIISTQVIIHAHMTMIEEGLEIQILKVSVGRLPIPTGFLMKQIRDKIQQETVRLTGNSMILAIDLPQATRIENLILEEDNILFHLKISIDSISDLMSLFEFFEKKE